jgi:hypothetical protein
MRRGPRNLTIPKEFQEDVRVLLSLSPEQIGAISRLLGSKRELGAGIPAYRLLAKVADLSTSDALDAWTAFLNLGRQQERLGLPAERVVDDLETVLPEDQEGLEPARRKALIELFSEGAEDRNLLEKADYLRNALVPHVTEVKTICDLRPLFDKARKEIKGATLVVLLGISSHNEEHEDETVVFQLTRTKLTQIRESLEEAERKLAVMEEKWKNELDLF